MKQISSDEFKAELSKLHLRVAVEYYGHSNNLNVRISTNGAIRNLKQLTDSQLVATHQVLSAVTDALIREQVERDILPKEVLTQASNPEQPKH